MQGFHGILSRHPPSTSIFYTNPLTIVPQSSLVFLTLMCLHFIIMFISSVLSWMLFVCDILLIAWLGYAKLYLDKDPRHWLTQFFNGTAFASSCFIFTLQIPSIFGWCITWAVWSTVLWAISCGMGRQRIVLLRTRLLGQVKDRQPNQCIIVYYQCI
jgi:hypothetical protein